ncbi:hypothetical protein [Xanthomonas sp. 1678]|uniref:hypothetical protein n=1 Tax=Xanthomonas sp. 1678 TaxID=3158788 RepID=UPI002863A49E|nr:hypothetical protein [Xanthomonas translucens]
MSEDGLGKPVFSIIDKIAALEYVMICVCHSHPDRDALKGQVGTLFEYLSSSDVSGNAEAIIKSVENMTGFSRQGLEDAPEV